MIFSYFGAAQLLKLSFPFKSSAPYQFTSERILSCFEEILLGSVSLWFLIPKTQKQPELGLFLSWIYRGKMTFEKKKMC